MNNLIFIYVFRHPTTNEIRYVGKTNNIHKRFVNHICRAKTFKGSRKVCNWIKKILAQNLLPLIEQIESCNSEEWVERERYWISFYKESGCNLCNLTDGGESNTGLVVSTKTRNLQSSVQKERHKLFPASQSTKDKIRDTLSKPVLCVSTNTVFKSIKEAVVFTRVPKTTFHRKLQKGELINGLQFIEHAL